MHPGESSLACALVAHHATSLADTLASELGILSQSQPILITSGKKVPPGTNGGVTLMGTGCSALGGFVIGAGAAILDAMGGIRVQAMAYILFGTTCGIVGSLVDSVLVRLLCGINASVSAFGVLTTASATKGATLQVTYYDPEKKVVCSDGDAPGVIRISGWNVLTNAQVNVASIVITSAVGAVIGPSFFY